MTNRLSAGGLAVLCATGLAALAFIVMGAAPPAPAALALAAACAAIGWLARGFVRAAPALALATSPASAPEPEHAAYEADEGLRDVVASLQQQMARLGAAGDALESTASSSLAVIEGGTLAQKQLEEGILEQTQIVAGAHDKVRAMADAIAELAGSAEQQTRTLDETALNVTSMSASIEQVSTQVESLLTVSSETTLTADRGGAAISTIVDAMTTMRATIADFGADIARLGRNSAQIGDIVKVIDGIAEQTNLLALNAAIEAARAGQHGRGFAVVAGEIRKLADGSVQATKEIAAHVGSTQSVVAQVTDAMARLNERLEASVESTDSASASLRDIVAAVMDANRQIGVISTVTRSMSENTYRVIRSIEEITSSVAANLAATRRMAEHSGEVSGAFDAITSISAENAGSVEVLTYVGAEMASATQRMAESIAALKPTPAIMEEPAS